MSITKQSAWTIFKGLALGQAEAKQAILRLTKGEVEAYECWVEDFNYEIAKIGVEANNEAATIKEDNPVLMAELESMSPSRWTADNYVALVSLFKGSKFEQLHLAAMFRFSNTELLLELAEPAI